MLSIGCRHECSFTPTHLQAARPNDLVEAAYECSFTRTHLEAARPNDLEAAANMTVLSLALTWRPRGRMTLRQPQT
jgi:hypothetical protein